MIFDQAIHYLPEILTGRGYPTQDYEGGVVAAFTMAVLQELNARNVLNPLSLIQCEKLYRRKSRAWPSIEKGGAPRYLRADLNLQLYEVNLGSPALAAYGWRYNNWLEAKFFRAFHLQTGLPKANSNQSIWTGSLLADLYRILALCPRGVPYELDSNPKKKNRSNIGRYLLHVYSGRIEQHLSLSRRNGNRKRKWLETITSPGSKSISSFSLADEPSTIVTHVGSGLSDLKIKFACTNTVIQPAETNPKSVTFTCILTRIDEFKLTLNGDFWGVNNDRSIVCNKEDDDYTVYKKISEFVGGRISLKGNIEESKPSKLDLERADEQSVE